MLKSSNKDEERMLRVWTMNIEVWYGESRGGTTGVSEPVKESNEL